MSRTIGLVVMAAVVGGLLAAVDLSSIGWILPGAAVVLVTGFLFRQSHGAAPLRVLILGNGPAASKLIEELGPSDGTDHVIVGLVDDQPPDMEAGERALWRGPLDRLAEVVEETHADSIVVALADRRGHLPLSALLESRIRGVSVEDALDLYERLTGKMAIEALTPGALILSKGFRNHGLPETVARATSIAVALVGLFVLAPVLAVIAAAIKLDSEGPVLFEQARAGRGGRPFNLLKFRSMRPCNGCHSEWVQDNTDRITRIGRTLRRFRLDELPQLVNILRGEMNLIGPRPHPVCNQEIFEKQIAYYSLRSTVRPGVTGWAQVRYGYANNIDEETEKMRYDLYYIKNRSLRLDARILLETVGIVLFGQGSEETLTRSAARDVGTAMREEPTDLSPVPVELETVPRQP